MVFTPPRCDSQDSVDSDDGNQPTVTAATLVSLGRLDDAGLHMHIGYGYCTVTRGCDGEEIGSIPRVNGLHRVYHDEERDRSPQARTLLTPPTSWPCFALLHQEGDQ